MMPPGGPPDPNAGGGLPPELAGLLGGAGAGPGPGQGGPPPPDQGAGGGTEDAAIKILHQMIGLAQNYLDVEPDPGDKATMSKLLATLHGYLAKDQADRDKLLGNPALARVLR